MPALVTPSETLHERVERLVCSDRETWPPLHSTSTQAAIAELIERVDGLGEAVHAMAREIERLSAEHRSETMDD